MNNDILQLVIYIVLALGVSFLCSIAETVLLSVTPSHIEEMKSNRPKRARLLQRLKLDRVDQSLAAILTLNTIAHTVGAIGAGAKATIVFGSTWFGLFSALMTFMILFFSEIVPKTIGAVYWPRLTGLTAFFVQALVVVLYPVVWLSEQVTRLIARGHHVHVFSREEFIAMARLGERTGHIHGQESRIIRNLLKYDSLNMVDIMTPRTVVSAFSEELCVSDVIEIVSALPFSRLPLYHGGIDHITGFALKDDILIAQARGEGSKRLADIKREVLTVPETMVLSSLLEHFLQKRQHLAVVVDEYGGTKGLVSLEDLVETLLGMEIMDETDDVEDMRTLARSKWKERASALGIHHEQGGTGKAEESNQDSAEDRLDG